MPLAEQVRLTSYQRAARTGVVSHAVPGDTAQLLPPTRKLRGVDAIVLQCVGYDEHMRNQVAEACDCPVILPRRMIAAALAQVV